MTLPPSSTAATLVKHGEFLRAIATDLLGNREQAADAVAQAGVAAVRGGPKDPDKALPWLKAVTRNAALKLRRNRARRRHHEAGAARAEATDSTADEVARHEIVQLVARAVAGLAEPFRTTILLRYYEGLAPTAIAARQDVPVATVNTRVHRGLAKLRDDLDRSTPGARDWKLGLAAAVLPPKPEIAVASTAGTKTGLLLGLAILAVPLGVLFLLGPDPAQSPASAGLNGATARAGESPSDAANGPPRSRPPGGRTTVRAGAPISARQPRQLLVSGSVVDASDRPIPGAWILIGPSLDRLRFRHRCDADGRFAFAQTVHRQTMCATSARHAPSVPRQLTLPPAPAELPDPLDLRIRLTGAGMDVHGRVTDDLGRPIASATVFVGRPRSANAGGRAIVRAPELPGFLVVTDENGSYAAPGVAPGWCAVIVDAAQLCGQRRFASGSAGDRIEVDFVLSAGFIVEGVVADSDGRPTPKAEVRWGNPGAIDFRATGCDSHGRFRLGPLPPGSHKLTAEGSTGRSVRGTVRGTSGEIVTWHPSLTDGRVLRGRLRTPGGTPLAHWRVSAHSDTWPGWSAAARTEEDGSFAIPQCRARVRVEVGDADAMPWLVECGVVVDGTPLALTIDPTASTLLRGRVALPADLSGGGVEVRLQHVTDARMRLTGGRGESVGTQFDVSHVPPGRYQLVVLGGAWGWWKLTEFSLVAGEEHDLGVLAPPLPGSVKLATTKTDDVADSEIRWMLERLEPGVRLHAGRGVPPAVISLAPGNYRLETEVSTGPPQAVRFTIASDRETPISVSLERP